MKLYLIRHAETTDNLSRFYAGSRDSPLTLHGVTQARLLAHHFSSTRPPLTHIFSSPLSRAHKTALALRDAQHQNVLEVIVVPELRERDFGLEEGQPYGRGGGSGAGGEDNKSVGMRAEKFLDGYLIPLLQSGGEEEVAVVSHGILLSHLWRKLLQHLSRERVLLGPAIAATRGDIEEGGLEYLGTWSNTGYLELLLSKDSLAGGKYKRLLASSGRALNHPTTTTPLTASVFLRSVGTKEATLSEALTEIKAQNPATQEPIPFPCGWTATILAVDNKSHLAGLKRQRGGIGRLAHDERQRKLESFFPSKRLKAG